MPLTSGERPGIAAAGMFLVPYSTGWAWRRSGLVLGLIAVLKEAAASGRVGVSRHRVGAQHLGARADRRVHHEARGHRVSSGTAGHQRSIVSS